MMITDVKTKEFDKIMNDIANYCKQLASAKNIRLDSSQGKCIISQDPVDMIQTYHRTMNKTFPNKERNVVISKTLEEKIKTLYFLDKGGNTVDKQEANNICNLIKIFEKKFQDGEDVTNHLSKGTFSCEEDLILNNWNLRHLHLNDVETAIDKRAMSSNRSSWLLFFLLTDDEVDFVDVVWHPTGAGFTAYRFLEIIQENGWMEKIGFEEIEEKISESLESKITNDKDIYILYKRRINSAFEFNGKVYITLGVTCEGYGVIDIIKKNQLKKDLRLILDENKYVGIVGDKSDNEKIVLMFEGKDGNKSEMEFTL